MPTMPRTALLSLLLSGHAQALRPQFGRPAGSFVHAQALRPQFAGGGLVATAQPGKAQPEVSAVSLATNEPSPTDLVRFIVPTLAGWLSSEVMSLVDTGVVGQASSASLAALGPATMLTDSTVYLFFWLNVATTSLFAQSLAAKRPNEAYAVLSDSLWCALACGLGVTGFLHFFGGGALAAICRATPAVLPAASTYLRVRLLGVPFYMVGMVLHAACLGAQDAITPLLVLMLSAGVNLGLDLYLVLGLGRGIGGAAWATVAAQIVQVTLLAFAVQRKRGAIGVGDSRPHSLLRAPPSAGRVLNFVRFAGRGRRTLLRRRPASLTEMAPTAVRRPMAFVLFGKITCYNAMTLVATKGGVVSLAAHQVLGQLSSASPASALISPASRRSL